MTDYLITYRNATVGDAHNLDKLNQENLPENYDIKDWIFVLENYNSYCYVAEHNGVIVGYCICIPNTDHRKVATIASIAVNKRYRSNGVGKVLLIKSILAIKRKDKSYIITLNCRHSNEAALNLYKKLNFTIENTIEHYYQHPTEHAYVLIKK